MLNKIKSGIVWLAGVRTQVAAYVLKAEKEFGGKTGKERRAIVVSWIVTPLRVNWLVKSLASLLVGKIVDKICDSLNILTDGDFANLEATPETIETVARASKEAVLEVKHAVTVEADHQKTVDERLAELYRQYGIEAPVVEEPAPAPPLPTPTPTPTPANDKWDRCIAIVGVAEGGANFDVVNGQVVLKEKSKNDKGGPTKYGITHGTLASAYAKGIVAHNDIVKLTKDEAKTIYRTMYCDPYGWLELPFEACLCLLDATINHGLGGTATISQRTYGGLAVDGKWGPLTKAAVWEAAQASPKIFAREFLRWRKDYFDRIIKGNPSQEVFRNGWYNRLRRLADECSVASPV